MKKAIILNAKSIILNENLYTSPPTGTICAVTYTIEQISSHFNGKSSHFKRKSRLFTSSSAANFSIVRAAIKLTPSEKVWITYSYQNIMINVQ